MTGNEIALMASIAVNMQDKEVDKVLDNIRSDIEKECVTCEYEDDFVYNSGLLKAIEIIDKYRG